LSQENSMLSRTSGLFNLKIASQQLGGRGEKLDQKQHLVELLAGRMGKKSGIKELRIGDKVTTGEACALICNILCYVYFIHISQFTYLQQM